ncbi:unnamed protein product, partial [Polarella glacialis]
ARPLRPWRPPPGAHSLQEAFASLGPAAYGSLIEPVSAGYSAMRSQELPRTPRGSFGLRPTPPLPHFSGSTAGAAPMPSESDFLVARGAPSRASGFFPEACHDDICVQTGWAALPQLGSGRAVGGGSGPCGHRSVPIRASSANPHAWQTASADIAELNDIIELANQVQEQLLASKLEGAPGGGGAAPELRPQPRGAQSPLGSGCGAAMRRPNGFDDPEPPKLMEPVAGTSSCSSGPALRSSSVPAHGSRFLGAEGAHRWTSVAPTSSTMCWSGGPLGPMAVSVAALPYAACTDCYSVLSTSPPLPPASEEVDARLAALEARQYGASASEVPCNLRHDSQELLQSARRLALEADVDRLRRELSDARADRARLLQVEASEATAAEAAAEVSNAEAARSLREAQSEADGLKAALRRKQSELDAHLEREKGETQRQRSEAQELRAARDAALHAREEPAAQASAPSATLDSAKTWGAVILERQFTYAFAPGWRSVHLQVQAMLKY